MKKLVAGLLSVGLLFTGFSSAQAEGKALGHYKDKAQGKAIGHIQKVEQEVSVVPEPTVKEVPVIETLTGGITDSVRGGCGAQYYVCGSNPQLLEAIIFKGFVNGSADLLRYKKEDGTTIDMVVGGIYYVGRDFSAMDTQHLLNDYKYTYNFEVFNLNN